MLVSVAPNSIRKIVSRNIEACFPELDDRQRKALIRRSLIESGKTFTEFGYIWLRSPEKVLGKVKSVAGESEIRELIDAGKPVLIALPHIGAWEIVGLYFGGRYPMTALYRPPRLSGVEQLISKARSRVGTNMVPVGSKGVRAMSKALKRGELVTILPDQEPRRGQGVFADFMGVPAFTMTLLPRLISKFRARVFFVSVIRKPRGRGFHIEVQPAPEEIYSDDMDHAATALNRGVEESVRLAPEQYQWAYKRFRTVPEGQVSIYKD